MTRIKTTSLALAAFTGLCGIVISSTAGAEALNPQTRKNLEAAMHGEAYANLKYRAYADAARIHGNKDIAKLFDESANVEANEHFAREADALGLAGTDAANLADAVAGEHYENTQMYIGFADQAEKVGDKKTAALFRQIAADEGDHYQQYKDALASLKVDNKPMAAREAKHESGRD